MKIGLNSWFGYSMEIHRQFQMIKDHGFDTTAIWWGDEFDEMLGCRKEDLPRIAANVGLFIENVHVPFHQANALWTDTEERLMVMKMYEQAILDCNHFGIPTIVLHPTSGVNPPPFSMQGVQRLRDLLHLAEDKCVLLAFENTRYPDYLVQMVKALDSPNLKLCYDSGHDHCFASTDIVTRYPGRIGALHLHDNNGRDDQHLLPGEGSFDWDRLAVQLHNVRYQGSIFLEVIRSHRDFTADAFLGEAYHWTSQFAKRVESECM